MNIRYSTSLFLCHYDINNYGGIGIVWLYRDIQYANIKYYLDSFINVWFESFDDKHFFSQNNHEDLQLSLPFF